ncbi:GT-D fold domain-containing protein [Neobacillus dielmonensis]|uniref:GT-D fold domain-containing protein n=1 Tax=Neobacillus dielmonensis TaxID=1347369 RepID=UPI0005A97F34|nr:GT-D fold domain-containing glycosyltransferase [Neobacillus dielmonensis]
MDPITFFKQGKYVEPYHIVKMLEEASSRKTALSLSRFGHTEVGYASWPENQEWTWNIEYFSRYAGIDVDRDIIKAELTSAIREADIVGLYYPWDGTDFDKECSKATHDFLERIQYFPPIVCSNHIGVQLALFTMFWDWLKTQRVAIVGRLAQDAIKVFGEKGVTVTLTSNLEGFSQVDDVYQKLLGFDDWDVAIISAGVPATIFAPKIAKATNKIALDFGHALNMLVDENYQHDKTVHEWYLTNQQNHE